MINSLAQACINAADPKMRKGGGGPEDKDPAMFCDASEAVEHCRGIAFIKAI